MEQNPGMTCIRTDRPTRLQQQTAAAAKAATGGAHIVSQVHPEVQIVARASIVGVEVAPAPVGTTEEEELEALHGLPGCHWQPAHAHFCSGAARFFCCIKDWQTPFTWTCGVLQTQDAQVLVLLLQGVCALSSNALKSCCFSA